MSNDYYMLFIFILKYPYFNNLNFNIEFYFKYYKFCYPKYYYFLHNLNEEETYLTFHIDIFNKLKF